MRKTKIICTLGPATDSEDVLREMILCGMNVARLNFSHGTHEEHRVRADMVKKLRSELKIPVAVMIDTKGPDIRVGKFKGNFVELKTGDIFTLTADRREGDNTCVSVTYPQLPDKLSPGDAVMLDDGLIKLKVQCVSGREVRCEVLNGGILANNKSVNIPGVKLDIPYMREQDIADINFAVDNNFDFIAASFVRSARDISDIREILKSRGAENIQIISKIENSDGIENIGEILALSDSIMIARGDMGVELPFEILPVVQKSLIKKAQEAGRHSITATQMLESMIKNPRPTRAEISDVANAIYDGTSAIMLSGETSVGKYPVETIRTMVKIAETAEADIDYPKRLRSMAQRVTSDVTDAVSHAAATLADTLAANAIIAVTKSGRTASLIARYRPSCPIICFTPDEKVCNQLSLSWGCVPMKLEYMENSDALFAAAMRAVTENRLVSPGGKIVFTAGVPLERDGTNSLRVGIVDG